METLNVGVVGAGTMGKTHARCWSRLPGARVLAVADPQINKAETLAAAVADDDNAPRAVADAGDLLASVDVVSVCVPTVSHRAVAEAALAAGKHVLCEKPLALTLTDCDAMIASAQRANVVFTVGQVVRFFPEYAGAKRLVQAGKIGAPAAARTRRGGDFPRTDTDWYADPKRSGGIVFDLLVHDIDWLLWCFGPVQRVFAKGLTDRLADKALDHLDYALLTLRHESGVISHVEGTWADPGGFVTAFEIAGDRGLLSHDSRKTAPLTKSVRQAESGGGGVAVPASPLAPGDDPYFRQIAAFAAAIRENAALIVTPGEARAAVAVAVAARQSMQTGKAEPVQ